MQRAVCMLIQRTDGKILAVSRKDDPTAFGLPGGKVLDGEHARDAVLRELREETGLIVHPDDARSIFINTCFGEVAYLTETFVANAYQGHLQTSEPIEIAWVDPDRLVEGPFGAYNEVLFDALGITTCGVLTAEQIQARYLDHVRDAIALDRLSIVDMPADEQTPIEACWARCDKTWRALNALDVRLPPGETVGLDFLGVLACSDLLWLTPEVAIDKKSPLEAPRLVIRILLVDYADRSRPRRRGPSKEGSSGSSPSKEGLAG